MELRRRSSTPQDAASRAPRFGNSLRIAPRETSGTEGSNPSSSSSESRANLISTVGVVGSKRVFNLANPAEILSPLMLAACGAGKRRVQGSAPGSGVAARHVHDPQKTRSTRIYSASFSNTAGKVSRNLNPAHKLLEGIAKLFGMAKVTGAAAGRDFLRNHNHTRGVCWLGRSFLPTDFPDPDRPCERNPGPPTGVSSLTMARARKKSHARFGLTPGGQDRRPGQGRDGEARGRLLPRSGEPHADAAAH